MQSDQTTPPAPTTWRPPTWRDGDEPDEPLTPENVYEKYAAFRDEGYYTVRGKISPDVPDTDAFREEAEDVSHNHKLLRDAWNTHPTVWRLYAALIGCEPVIDSFWNPGTQGLPALKRKLDGRCPENDGMLTVHSARGIVSGEEWNQRAVSRATRDLLSRRLDVLGDVPDNFPANWRGEKLKRGSAPAAANGPHSCTGRWLPMVVEYGKQDFAAAFTPDNGDGYYTELGLQAQIVIRLGRVYCDPAPGIPKSNPTGSSALLVYIPPTIDRATLPSHTQRVLEGNPIAVPMWARARAGMQYAYCQRGGLRMADDGVVDLGLVK